MSDVKNTRTLNDTDRSSQRMQNHHSHQANQTTHIAQAERENNIFSQDVKERVNMARQGENLDVLVHDSCPMVRREVAMRGYGLNVLLNDEASIVRQAVASTGYYDLSSFKNETSSIVRNAAEVGHNAMKEALSIRNHKIDKYEAKIDKYEAQTAKINSELNKLNTAKSTHRVRMYAEYDSATNSNRVHLKLDTTRMSAAELAQHKRDNRGLLHKIDSTFKNENVGLVYAKLQKPLTYGEDGKRHLQSPVTFHSLSIRPPKLLRKAGNALWQQALKEEAGLFRYGDTAKRLLIDPASQAAKVAVLNKLNEAGRDNLAVDIASKGTRTTLAATRVLMDYRKDMLAYKPTQLQNKRDRLANKQARLSERLDKAKMKTEIAGHKAIFNAANDRAKNTFGLNPSVKKDKVFVKNSWALIHDGVSDVNGKNYIAAPPKQRLDKNSMSKAEYKHQKKLNKLEKKEFKANKKAYETVSVKQAYFNKATGQVKTRTVTMVDKTRPKKPKAKKPSSLGGRAALEGLGELRYKAFNAMAQDDNAAVSAAGKGANAAFSELSKAHAASLKRKEQLFEKRVNKARMKTEKTSAKLQAEKSRTNFSEKNSKKTNKKKARKKLQQKKRNAEIFKKNLKKAAQKTKDVVAKKIAEFFASKGTAVILGGAALFVLLLMPLIFLFMFGGGGGGAAPAAPLVTASYLTDREGLIDYNNDVNNLYWQWQSKINNEMAEKSKNDTTEWLLVLNPCLGGPISSCPSITGSDYKEHPDNVYRVIKHLYGGESIPLSDYDMMCLYAYFTVKYRDEDWSSVSSELGSFFDTYFVLKPSEMANEKIKYVLDTHITISCSGNHDHFVEAEPHEVDTIKIIEYSYLYPKDESNPMTIQKYISEKLKEIGEPNEDGLTEGELHYNMLMQSLGLHQVIDYPIYNVDTGETVDWSAQSRKFGTFGELYDVNGGSEEEGVLPDYRYRQVTENSVNIFFNCNQLEAKAGGDGIITDKTSDSVTIEYKQDNLIVTYTRTLTDSYGHMHNGTAATGLTELAVGNQVSAGTHLFYSDIMIGYYPSIQLTAYCTETNSYINPLLVIKSKVY